MNLLCLDFGGTYVKRGIITDTKKIVEFEKVRSIETIEGAIEIVSNFHKEASSKKINIDGIAISMYGIIGNDGLSLSHSTESWYHEINFANKINALFPGIKVHCVNDGNAALLGAIWRGDANKNEDNVALTIGTGLGGSFWINGKLASGSDGASGQIGSVLNYDPQSGKIENQSVLHSIQNQLNRYERRTGIKLSGEEYLKYIESSKSNSKDIDEYKIWIKRIGLLLYSVSHLLNPSKILLAGGVLGHKGLFEQIQKSYEEAESIYPYKLHTKVVLMPFVGNGNLFGAAFHWLEKENSLKIK